jgi:2-polyprenyl-3-methyl-5-hydroxy-6-metoxy-1,4-benzoquinol methylase
MNFLGLRVTRSREADSPAGLKELTRNAVVWAYRLFLDREPESEQVIDDHLRKCSSTRELRDNFIYSTEFRRNNPALHVPVLIGDEPAMSIEDRCSDDQLQQLFDHVQSTWQELGETEPHWSVVIADQYRQANIGENKDEFYRTGEQHVAQLFGSLERSGIDYSRFKTCLDYGCGVGRITRHLAARFERVNGYDISLSHLRHAESYLNSRRISNVTLGRTKRVRDVEDLPKVDVAFSMLVLQHNPPPVIAFLIDGLIQSLNPGGVAFFQVPTYRLGYSFSVVKYLAHEAPKREMEMHVLPQRRIFEIAQACGARVLEVIDDGWTGIRLKEVSNTFVIQRTP